MSALEDGLAAIAKGWPAFEVSSKKIPFGGSHGHLDATIDADEFRELDARYGGRNRRAAIALGDGEVLVDIDTRNGGDASAVGLDRANADVDKAGGPHFFFRAAGMPLINGVLPGIDLKTAGGYAVVHDADLLPSRTELRPMPKRTRAIIDAALAERGSSLLDDNLTKETIPDGEVNDTLKDHAWELAAYYDEDEIVAMLRVVMASRAEKALTETELRAMARGAASKRRGDRSDPSHALKIIHVHRGVAPVASSASVPALVTVTARDLLAHPPAPPVEVIPGLVPAGLSLLASAPKVGKSWLAYQEAVAVATGGDVLGRIATQGDVLYLALEDGEYRAWSRIASILRRTIGRERMPSQAAELKIAFNSMRGDALVEQIEQWIDDHPHAVLILIDTLQKVRPGSTGRRNQYELDVEDVGRILAITQRHPGIGLQVVHHDTKASRTPGSDFVDAVSGTSGIAGSVDAISVLRRKRHEATGTLDVTGKDIAESFLHLAYDTSQPFWAVDPLGGITDEQREAYDWIEANGAAGAKAVADGMARERTSTQRLLDRLVDGGVLKKTNGRFDLPMRISFRNNSTDSTDDNDGTDGTHSTRRSA